MPLPCAFTAVIGDLSVHLEPGRMDETAEIAGSWWPGRPAPRPRRRLPAPARAGRAHAHQLGPVLDLREAVLGRDRARPVVEPAVVDPLHAPADAARQVVVMAALAEQERLLAAVAPEGVGDPLLREPLEVAVDGREPDAVEVAVQLLRGHRAIRPAQGLEDRVSLLGLAAHETRTIINLN